MFSRLLRTRSDDGEVREKLAERTFSFDATERTVSPKYELAATAIFKNVDPYLEEWIEFHRLVGVQHFYIYDNESTDRTGEILAAYQKKGLATTFVWPSMTGWNAQYAAYAHSTKTQRIQCRWMMFIDIDEFVFPAAGSDLRAALAGHSNQSIVKLPWRCFGHSGHTHRPEGLVTANYRYRFDPNPSVKPDILRRLIKYKSIVDPCRVIKIHIHEPEVDDNRVLVDDRTILLNHYILLSEDEFSSKRNRGYGFRSTEARKTRAEKLLELRDAIEASTIEDTAILRFIPALSAALRPAPGVT